MYNLTFYDPTAPLKLSHGLVGVELALALVVGDAGLGEELDAPAALPVGLLDLQQPGSVVGVGLEAHCADAVRDGLEGSGIVK